MADLNEPSQRNLNLRKTPNNTWSLHGVTQREIVGAFPKKNLEQRPSV